MPDLTYLISGTFGFFAVRLWGFGSLIWAAFLMVLPVIIILIIALHLIEYQKNRKRKRRIANGIKYEITVYTKPDYKRPNPIAEKSYMEARNFREKEYSWDADKKRRDIVGYGKRNKYWAKDIIDYYDEAKIKYIGENNEQVSIEGDLIYIRDIIENRQVYSV